MEAKGVIKIKKLDEWPFPSACHTGFIGIWLSVRLRSLWWIAALLPVGCLRSRIFKIEALQSFLLFLTLLQQSPCFALTCAVTVTLWETDTNLRVWSSTFTAGGRVSPLFRQPFELMTPYFYHIPSTAVNSDLMTQKLHIVNVVRFYVFSMLLQAASIKVLLWFIHQWGEPVWKTRQQPCCKRGCNLAFMQHEALRKKAEFKVRCSFRNVMWIPADGPPKHLHDFIKWKHVT